MNGINLALLTTELQYWQEVAKELVKSNKRQDAIIYIEASSGCDTFEAFEIADQLKARLINEAAAKSTPTETSELASLRADNARMKAQITAMWRGDYGMVNHPADFYKPGIWLIKKIGDYEGHAEHLMSEEQLQQLKNNQLPF